MIHPGHCEHVAFIPSAARVIPSRADDASPARTAGSHNVERVNQPREILRGAQDDEEGRILLAFRESFRHALNACAHI